jgi:hypothetical protein
MLKFSHSGRGCQRSIAGFFLERCAIDQDVGEVSVVLWMDRWFPLQDFLGIFIKHK